MKTRCIIVDDEPIARIVIKNHLLNFNNIEIVDECKNAVQAFEVLSKVKVDLIFLDIQMPQITGIDFLKTLRNTPKVIIITAYRDYAVEGFELDVIDYLLKPVSLERFMKAVNKYYQQTHTEKIKIRESPEIKEAKFIYVNENKRIRKIFLSDIMYFESMSEYVKIITKKDTFITKNSISSFEKQLASENFIRVHKSFIISVPHIKSFNSTSIELENIEIPISRTYKNAVFAGLNYNKGKV